MNLGTRIRLLRIAKDLTITDFADQAGCSPSFISQLENNRPDPSISMLKRIAKAPDANLVDFFMAESQNHHDVLTRVKDRVDIRRQHCR